MLGPNIWNEPDDKIFTLPGHRAGAKHLASGLLAEGFDIAYAYKPLTTAGARVSQRGAVSGYDRKGFSYPLVPCQINSYGRRVVVQRAGLPNLSNLPTEETFDPPSPTPRRCFDLGAAAARVLARSPWRVALIASSGWSHAFLTEKNHWHRHRCGPRVVRRVANRGLRDVEKLSVGSDRRQRATRGVELVLFGGRYGGVGRKPAESTLIETWVMNSNKCFAFFTP